MITQNYHQKLSKPDLLIKYADIDKILFFDIETTGLSPDSSFIYLISYGYFKEENFYLTQLFAENMKDEISVLTAFDQILSDFTLLAQFNGNRFDIPYVKARFNYHNITSHMSSLEYFDIYLHTKAFKKFFKIPNCKLKTFEKLLQIRRKDLIDGGEAINEYYNYVSCGDESSLKACLLHNYEDVLNLPELSKLLIFEHLKDISCYKFDTFIDNDYFIIEVETGQYLNISITHNFDFMEFIFDKHYAKIIFKIDSEQIKHHHCQYHKYIYLNNEKYAIDADYAKTLKLKNYNKCTINNAFSLIHTNALTNLSESDIIDIWNDNYKWILLFLESKKA